MIPRGICLPVQRVAKCYRDSLPLIYFTLFDFFVGNYAQIFVLIPKGESLRIIFDERENHQRCNLVDDRGGVPGFFKKNSLAEELQPPQLSN